MKTLVVHISDIHLDSTSEHLFSRATKIAEAALSAVETYDEIHVVATGDLINRGAVDQFARAARFIRSIAENIERLRGIKPLIVTCPGNHDCDFSGDQSVRDVLLKAASTPDASDGVISQIGSVLREYFETDEKLSPDVVRTNRWHSEVSSQSVRYVILNSALTSSVSEKPGQMYMPLPGSGDAALLEGQRTIYLMHHPFNWLQQDNARQLAQHAASHADLFLMGHEHVSWATTTKELYDGSAITYFKAHVLNDTGDIENSAFQTITLDSDEGFLSRSFKWSAGRYALWDERSLAQYSSWPSQDGSRKLAFLDEYFRELSSVGANFTHRRKSQLSLPDIFVWPSLKRAVTSARIQVGANEANELSSEEILTRHSEFSKFIVIRGGEQSGKTALSKVLATGFARKGIYPLLLTAANVSSWREKSLNERLDAVISTAYGKNRRDDYRQLHASRKVLIIDDFDLAQVTQGYFEGLRALRAHFGQVILFLDSYPGLEVALNEFLLDESFVDAEVFDILDAGPGNRLSLIEKWISIGTQDPDREEQKVMAAKLSKVVDETLGRNLIPTSPVFILIVLQRAELAQDLDTVVKSGSQGFLYESLIIQALSTKVKAASVVTCLAYLSHFAQELMSLKLDSLPQSKFDEFHVRHCSRYALNVPIARLQEQLVDAGILDQSNGNVSFKYPFHNYYFTARALSQLDSWLLLEPEIDRLVESIHTERNANILLFIAHIKRNALIAEKLISKAQGMFPDSVQVDLFGSHELLNKYDSTTVRAILREGNRNEQLAESHQALLYAEASQQELAAIAEARLKDKINDALSMNAAFKTLQVLGQILRNHAGEIERTEKLRIASTCSKLGLKVLDFMLSTVAAHGPELLEFRAAQLRVERPKMDAMELTEEMENYLASFASNLCMGTLIKIANAIGAEDLAPTLDDSLAGNATNRLLRIVTHLEHFSEFPKKQLIDFQEDDLKDAGFLPNNVLRRFIVRRLYLFPAREELKRDVLDRFKIKALPFKFLGQHRAN
ncbi:metallophosphoesterase [Stenotrophomonas rhizophila]|uniref:STAND family AAA ATPase n=1 Tax=Stenotrophomonas rhizophila TaxID=216778 RepID=UPI001AEC3369|nr:metallophosphoesterase [Stenotrophomonas rhizophila]